MDTQQFSDDVKKWADDQLSEFKAAAADLGIEHRENSKSPRASLDAISARTSNKFGVPYKVSFKFPRHLVFVHKGVGRGTPIGAVGSNGRKAKPWFEPVLDKNIEQLGNIVAEGLGDVVVNNFKL